MATDRQKRAARQNLEKARAAQSTRAHGRRVARAPGLSTAEENRMSAKEFAFPKERKEPLPDAAHVRNAIARFDQVEGVSHTERDEAWKRIRAAARKFGVEVESTDWRELVGGGSAGRR
jgi:hypothetical protein